MKKQITNVAKAGKLLCLDGGEYSDYQVFGFFVVLQDFTPMAEIKLFEDTPEGKDANDYGFDARAFLAFLLRKGLLLEIEYGTFFLGTYCSPAAAYFQPV